jgi:flagellar biogenesis protein FliO
VASPLIALAQSAADELPAGTTGFGTSLVRSALSLLAVCVAAWALVRFAARRGLLGAAPTGTHLRVIERLALDPRRALYLVRLGPRAILLGASEDGLRALGDVPLEALGLDDDSVREIKSPERGQPTEARAAEAESEGGSDGPAVAGARRAFIDVVRGGASP